MRSGELNASQSRFRSGVRHRNEQGATLLHLLIVLFVLSLVAAHAAPRLMFELRRERELALLEAGIAYENALSGYYLGGPGTLREFPPELSELTRDNRYLRQVRWLRRLPLDPMVPARGFVPVRDAQGRVVGVRSSSTLRAIGTGGGRFPAGATYDQWVFDGATRLSTQAAPGP